MSVSQLRPLVSLRWRMVRSRRVRWGFAALAAAVPVLCAAAVAVAVMAPDERSDDVLVLAPTAYFSAAVLAVLAPLFAGGGQALFPDDQLVAFPVTSQTRHDVSLGLIPLNLAWSSQLVFLLGVTAYPLAGSRLLGLALVTCLAYVGCVTAAGLAVAWLVVGLRQNRHGRQLTWSVAALLLLAGLVLLATGNVTAALDRLPTRWVVIGAIDGANGDFRGWLVTTGLLLVLTAVGVATGRLACDWALRRPGDAVGRIDARTVPRRKPGRSVRAAVLATDRASVWRSAPLRRGLVVLAVVPGTVAAVAGLSWASLVLLPGLVAAGAGLLFGVNAFSLDGSGAVWLASLPRQARTAFWSKAQVVGEVCVVAIIVTLTAGSLRTGRLPDPGEAVALAACAVVVLLRVVATCMTLSVTRPHRADLRGPRDTPAPPGVMAAYSVRLAVSTTMTGVVFAWLAQAASWQWSVLWALPFALLSGRRLVRAAAAWSQPSVQSRVVTAVASG
jgi:hypothetical protein